ncbi:Bax inhibitor-1/YccA family protein [Sphingosinicella sp. BN140058]|uniref:Bax inhibitor-1/YccA family protein n=1 Tax=Sphingosinicella sp. BN140058 TaxID=1892855 RepID=UPI0010102302|nr:Bax inhibitor-1/YccA family protein [Sphingosinicella sp. BN140058]QAY80489.1 Bax inhibitor-1/YccA family protein [Sphingosinicella sp. BN140058]
MALAAKPDRMFTHSRLQYDAALRRHMISVYNWLIAGLLLSAVTAYVSASTGLAAAITDSSTLSLACAGTPIAVALLPKGVSDRLSASGAGLMLCLFAGSMGVALSTMLQDLSGASLAATFLATAASLGTLSLFGYTTRHDLSRAGSLILKGASGLLIALLMNLLVGSPPVHTAISIAGVLLFTALTAFDTQRIKIGYLSSTGYEPRSPVYAALNLYLDFLSLFLFVVRLIVGRT